MSRGSLRKREIRKIFASWDLSFVFSHIFSLNKFKRRGFFLDISLNLKIWKLALTKKQKDPNKTKTKLSKLALKGICYLVRIRTKTEIEGKWKSELLWHLHDRQMYCRFLKRLWKKSVNVYRPNAAGRTLSGLKCLAKLSMTPPNLASVHCPNCQTN